MKRVDYLIEVFKSLMLFLLSLLSGIVFLAYMILIKKAPFFMVIFIGVGIIFVIFFIIALKKLNDEILRLTKECDE